MPGRGRGTAGGEKGRPRGTDQTPGGAERQTDQSQFDQRVAGREREWATDRWKGISREYSAADVVRLRASLTIEHTLASHGANLLWGNLAEGDPLAARGACPAGPPAGSGR